MQQGAERALVFGFMCRHLGARCREEHSDRLEPLRSRVSAGVFCRPISEFIEEKYGLRCMLEVQDRLRVPGTRSVHRVPELTGGTGDQVFIREGAIFTNRNQTDGAALGFGLQYERFEFGIARSLACGGPALQQDPAHLILGVAF
jgi:hypothetical protein